MNTAEIAHSIGSLERRVDQAQQIYWDYAKRFMWIVSTLK